MATKPQRGDQAPPFTAQAIGGQYGTGSPVSLSDFAGRHVVLYFYPKDHTPGCTMQACDLRDRWDDVSNRAVVFGISPDSPASHLKFIEGKKLPFPLISDPEKKIIEAYGCWSPTSLLGLLGLGTERSTFVIGPDQKILAVLEKVGPKRHVPLLLDLLPAPA